MYTVKFKRKGSTSHEVANNSIIQTISDLDNINLSLKDFAMSYKDANQLMMRLIKRKDPEPGMWAGDAIDLEYISLVELNTYAPYKPIKVLVYREF